MKLMIGSAQFGLDYGIACGKRVPEAEALDILSFAYNNGVCWIDTASSYNVAESVIGKSSCKEYFNIVTKIYLDAGRIPPEMMEKIILNSLHKLGVKSIYGLVIHDPNDFISDRGKKVFSNLCAFKDRGLVKKIGASVSTPDQAENIIDRFDIDIVQIPNNILDNRFAKKGTIKLLKDRGIEVHARSIFLQGLLLMNPNGIDKYFDNITDRLYEIKKFAEDNTISVRRMAIQHAKDLKEIDRVIVGVDNLIQFKEVLIDFETDQKTEFKEFYIDDESILNPSMWRLELKK